MSFLLVCLISICAVVDGSAVIETGSISGDTSSVTEYIDPGTEYIDPGTDDTDFGGREQRSTEVWRVAQIASSHDVDQMLSPFAPLHRQWGDDSLSYSTKHTSLGALKVSYRAGSYTKTSHRGAGFYSTPSEVPDGTEQLILMYDVYFDNFGWGIGGKLPGLFGGENGDGAYKCSGGSNPDTCFSLRLMWRKDGAAELYAYLPLSCQNDNFASRDDVIYHAHNGQSIGRGKIHFRNNAWQTVMIYARLNNPGQADGYVKVCNQVHGEDQQCFTARDIAMRDSRHTNRYLRGLYFSTFFGGSSPDYAAPRDCSTHFKNFRLKLPTGYVVGK